MDTLTPWTTGIQTDPAGNSFVFWTEYYGTEGRVLHVRRRSSTGTWDSSPTQLTELSEGWADTPKLELDSVGNATAIWKLNSKLTDKNEVWAAWYNVNTDNWSAPERLDQADERADYPELAIDEDGNVFAAWVEIPEAGGNARRMMVRRFDASSAAWGAAAVLSEPLSGQTLRPSIDTFSNGHAIATWTQPIDEGTRLFSAVWTGEDEGWSPAVRVDLGTNTVLGDAFVRVGGNDRAVSVWSQYEDVRRVHSRTYDESSGWSASVTQSAEPSPQYVNAIDLDAVGNMLVGTEGFDWPNPTHSLALYLGAGATAFDSTGLLRDDGNNDAQSVAFDGFDDGLIGFEYNAPGAPFEARVQYFDGSTHAFTTQEVDLGAQTDGGREPRVAGFSGGGWAVAWRQGDHLYATTCLSPRGN